MLSLLHSSLDVSVLPTFNACMNLISASFLIVGYWLIRRQRREAHRRCMIGALFFSTIFLISYLYYHFHTGHTSFPNLGWIKTLYLVILIPHVILAAGMLPLIALTFYRAFRGEWTKHKRIARLTFPIWLYVSLSGVVVYLMLYQLFDTRL